MVMVGKDAPDFTLKGVLREQIEDFALKSYRGKWLVIFFYPADFTFICPTEVIAFSKMAEEFRAEDTDILGVSVDSLESHRGTFIINPSGQLSYLMVSHMNVGRSVEETLRVLKALRTNKLCPSDWKPGEQTGDVALKS